MEAPKSLVARYCGAMSEENIELIKRGMALFNRKDWDDAIQFLAEDAVWTTFFGSVAGPKSRYGRADIKQSWEDAAAVLGGDTYQIVPKEFRDLGGGTILVRAVLPGGERRAASTSKPSTCSFGPFDTA